MKCNLDLVRSILMYVENADDEVDADDMATERWPIETVAYHVSVLRACGDDSEISQASSGHDTPPESDVART